MATAKKAITFYASAEVLDWYNSLPDGEGSRSINEFLLKAIKGELEHNEASEALVKKVKTLEATVTTMSGSIKLIQEAVHQMMAKLTAAASNSSATAVVAETVQLPPEPPILKKPLRIFGKEKQKEIPLLVKPEAIEKKASKSKEVDLLGEIMTPEDLDEHNEPDFFGDYELPDDL
jgi:hypothetical protein